MAVRGGDTLSCLMRLGRLIASLQPQCPCNHLCLSATNLDISRVACQLFTNSIIHYLRRQEPFVEALMRGLKRIGFLARVKREYRSMARHGRYQKPPSPMVKTFWKAYFPKPRSLLLSKKAYFSARDVFFRKVVFGWLDGVLTSGAIRQ
jgi:hypothetical protein